MREAISIVKVATAEVAEKTIWRAMRMHGSLGVSNETPFGHMLMMSAMLGLADGPTEVHKVSVAQRVLGRSVAHEGFFRPTICRCGVRLRSRRSAWTQRR